MEIAEGEEDGLHLCVLVFKLFFDEEGESSEQISPETGRRLVGQLD